MQTESLTQPFDIVYRKLDVCPKSTHKHSFFELVYILSGSGIQRINNNTFEYFAGHMFLLTPEDSHSFDIRDTTEFVFIRFNNIYVRSQEPGQSGHLGWIQKLEYILHNATHQPGCILLNQPDKTLVKSLVESMLTEIARKQLYHQEVVARIVDTIITIVARNIGLALPNLISKNTTSTVVNLLNYIQENIYDPDKLRLKVIAELFNVTQSYLGRYFKKHTGETIQQYIIHYKLKLVETRLKHSDMRINEIVTELGFTDESHLNRLFKKYKGISPAVFRKQQQTVAAMSPLSYEKALH
ncbi:MAG TPA: AraC family transcriptional regulator [Puia sp.]|jgi:AraC-like DNA-binding protein|nr:AraC family transcriptional regulator [Puia sp.]